MSEEEKLIVHQEIDDRMQELEDTGLTRIELLHDNMADKGIRLKDDPFWQLIKNSRVSREMMVPPGGEFSADRVIEMALRQDFGPDPSLSQTRLKLKHADGPHTQQASWEYKKKYRDNDPMLAPEHHLA